MPSKKNRKKRIWNWIPRVKRFEKERGKLIACYQEKGNRLWVKILRRIHVPSFDWEYITNPEAMPAQFYIPGFSSGGEAIETFQCRAGELSRVFLLMLYVAGFTDETIPTEVRNLIEMLK